MTEVTKLFQDEQPTPEATPTFLMMAKAVAQICATRSLLLIAVLTGSVIWIWTVYDPSRDRLYAAMAFSMVFMVPLTMLYFRRG